MSEPIFSQPGGPGAAAPAAAEPAPAKGGNSKALLAVGGVVAALAVGAGAFFMLSGSSGDDLDGALAPVGPRASAPAVAPSAEASAPATTVKVKPAKVSARDPFVVLFPDPEPSAQASQGTTTGTGTTTTVQPQTTSHTISVTAIDPAAGTAKIKVDDKGYSATVGEKFAPYYTLYAVFNAQCVGVLFGDQNVPVCIGSPTTVTQ